MKKILFAAAFAIFAHTQAFAIIGAGAHYVMNTGSLKADKGSAYTLPDNLGSIDVDQQKASGLQGIGFKAWIDFLPFVDIEGTFNVAATRYKTTLIIPTLDGTEIKPKEIPLAYTPDAPYNMVFDRADPLYGIVSGDLTVTYPITSLPIIRPYAGLGISYLAGIPIINKDFAKKMLENSKDIDLSDLASQEPDAADAMASKIGEAIVQTLKDSEYKVGIGGHAIVGFRLKLPIIPLAVYTNGKYYFGGDVGSQFTQGFVLEVGGGLAI
jgi:hypothetical protein